MLFQPSVSQILKKKKVNEKNKVKISHPEKDSILTVKNHIVLAVKKVGITGRVSQVDAAKCIVCYVRAGLM